LKLMISPVQERIPIFIAAIGPRNTALTGEIADGWIPFMFAPEHVDELVGPLKEGAEKAGRSLDEVEIAPTVNVCIDDDIDRVRERLEMCREAGVGTLITTAFALDMEERKRMTRELAELL